MHRFAEIDCPLALEALFHFSPRGVCKIDLQLSAQPNLTAWAIGTTNPLLEQQIKEWLNSYGAGAHPKPGFALDYPELSSFAHAVLTELAQVPFGQCFSYSTLASRAGSPRAARAVGNALNQNPFPLILPCHRIVRADGQLGGFGCGCEVKSRLLDFENHHSESP